MNILKFGGTSMADHLAWKKVLDIVLSTKSPILVVSATSGTTNGLLKSAQLAISDDLDSGLKIADEIAQKHRSILESFIQEYSKPEISTDRILTDGFTHIDQLNTLHRNYLTGIHTLGELTDRSLDAIASIGERLSSYLIFLSAQTLGMKVKYIDAAMVIKTDSRFTQASPDISAITKESTIISDAVKDGFTPMMGGFYGSDHNGVVTTLGRGGSDFTASLIGLAVGADTIGIWTDVSGMYTSDPRFIKGTHSIPEISFGEAAELAYFGAKVLHPATIQPAVERNIPVLVKNTFDPDHPGTTIRVEAPYSGKIRAIAFKKDISVITVHSTRMLLAHGFIARVFTVFEQHQVSVDLVSTSEVSISITVDNARNLDAVVEDLKKFAQVSVRSGQALVCMVGQDLIDAKGLMKLAFTALEDIPVHMISQGSSDLNMSIVIDNGDVYKAVQVLHDTFITS
jgi:aspartate kinase